MKLNINQTYLCDVKNISVSNCELSIVFHKEHKYSNIEEIETLLDKAGLSIGNFHFKGVSMWNYPREGETIIINGEEVTFDDMGETSILCVIPQEIRNLFQIICLEE